MARVTSSPVFIPSGPAKLTPTPHPSPTACRVITPMNSTIFLASIPLRPENSMTSSYWSRNLWHFWMKTMPKAIPSTSQTLFRPSDSWIREYDAAIMTPTAMLWHTPSLLLSSLLVK